ncbi:heterokaryon incompatibility protein-domain-containing protein [Xylogone sp. PMI_703]|nr:heterokaryon incompatibility protein-domain-containing protein [Xylogone sp. PMI_703]
MVVATKPILACHSSCQRRKPVEKLQRFAVTANGSRFLQNSKEAMRLLDARALIHEGVSRLIDDTEVGKPCFAILSHTWGQEEVLFEDIALGPNHEIDCLTKEQRATRGYSNSRRDPKVRFNWFQRNEEDRTPRGVCESCRCRNQTIIRQQESHIKAGWKKIWSVCLQACRDGYDYVWIDTCCIDKSSSTELAEALNSMFQWYAMSSTCYVFLEDCRLCPHRFKENRGIFEFLFLDPLDQCTKAQISRCRWLSRGWTLQELIAPSKIKFFDEDWTILGERDELAFTDFLPNITGIDRSIFGRVLFVSYYGRYMEIKKRLRRYSIATKMSWAANRQTTRVEDRAYSLLGLFGVNMPLLYGEGNKAFLRLQEEIIRYSNDDSIFAWEFMDDIEHQLYENQLLAPSPEHFSWLLPIRSHDIRLYSPAGELEKLGFDEGFEITQKALHITLPLFHWHRRDRSNAKTTRKKNRSTYKIHFEGTLQGSNFRESNANEADLIKATEAPKESSTSGRSLKEDSTKTDSSKEILSEESLSDKGSFQRKISEDYTSQSEFNINFKKSRARLECYLGYPSGGSFIRVALRLLHIYRGDRYVMSQVMSEQPGCNELGKHIRNRIGQRLGDRHRLALYYLDIPEIATTQSIIIRRDGDINNI